MNDFWPVEDVQPEIIVRNGHRYQVLRDPSGAWDGSVRDLTTGKVLMFDDDEAE